MFIHYFFDFYRQLSKIYLAPQEKLNCFLIGGVQALRGLTHEFVLLQLILGLLGVVAGSAGIYMAVLCVTAARRRKNVA